MLDPLFTAHMAIILSPSVMPRKDIDILLVHLNRNIPPSQRFSIVTALWNAAKEPYNIFTPESTPRKFYLIGLGYNFQCSPSDSNVQPKLRTTALR